MPPQRLLLLADQQAALAWRQMPLWDVGTMLEELAHLLSPEMHWNRSGRMSTCRVHAPGQSDTNPQKGFLPLECLSKGPWKPSNGVCPSLCHADVTSCPNWSKLDSTHLHARKSFYIRKKHSGLPVEDLALPARCGGLGLLRSCRFGINSIGLRSDLWPSCVFQICLRRHAEAIVLLCGVLRRVKRGVSRLMTLVTTCSAFARELSGAYQCRVQV